MVNLACFTLAEFAINHLKYTLFVHICTRLGGNVSDEEALPEAEDHLF